VNINLPFLSLLLAGTIAASSVSHAGFGDNDDQKIEDGALSLYVGALRQVYENPTEQKVVTFRDGRRFAARFHGIPDWYGFSSRMPYSKGDDEKVYGSVPSGTPIEKAEEFFFREAMQMGGGERPIYDEQGNIIGYEPHPYCYGGDPEILCVTLKLMQDAPQQDSNNNAQLKGEDLFEDNPLKAPFPTPSQSSSQSGDEESDDLDKLTIKQIRQAVKDGTISTHYSLTIK
jgi:hypothetical protein